MEVAAIIPTRGSERKLFVHYQEGRAYDMGYDRVYVIDYPPVKGVVDIYERIAKGIELVKEQGYEWVSIIEDDDYYKPLYLNYLKAYMKNCDMIGFNRTTYYHLFKQEYRNMVHPGRSSLFTTTFKTELFDKFPVNPKGFFDIALWAEANRLKLNFKLLDVEMAIGIKHGIGLCGGNGHYMNLGIKDTTDYKYLHSRVDPNAFQFYMDIIRTLKPAWQQSQQLQRTK